MAGFDPNVVLESDSPETVRELIRAGIGISFIPILTWQDMEDEHIALVPISTPHCRRYINLSWRESSYLSPAPSSSGIISSSTLPNWSNNPLSPPSGGGFCSASPNLIRKIRKIKNYS